MASPGWKNKLFYGDNLDVLRKHHEELPDGSVDLIYLDPPFNSNANYNVLFRDADGKEAASQLHAFSDTWKWGDTKAPEAYFATVEHGPQHVSDALRAFRSILGDCDMLAYLAMMAPRLIELRRVLKPTGSIYLHCDPTAGHYLKLLMDSVFGTENYVNQITWKRTTAHSDAKQGRKGFGNITDVLLYYSKTGEFKFHAQFRPYDRQYVEDKYPYSDPNGKRYGLWDMTGPGGAAKGNPHYELMGVTRYWRYSKKKMGELVAQGRVVQPSEDAVPRYKRYLDEMPGVPVQNLWDDISPVNSQADERIGYPTQKPEALLERVILASSDPGDLLLDPFCGCGTAIAVADRLERRWVGIDITQAAMVVIKQRFPRRKRKIYDVLGEPVTLPDAQALAKQDPYQFQWWALGLVDSRPIEKKKGQDKGIDGRLTFHDDPKQAKEVILSVKSGHLLAQHVRDLRGVIEREKAAIGVLVSMAEPTGAMHAEAASAGVYKSPWGRKQYPRLQLLTVADLLKGETIDMPREEGENITFGRPPKKPPASARPGKPPQRELFAKDAKVAQRALFGKRA
jgi:DNA modification methylase